ncbi:uncharacterized protein LOC143735798 [Siphateles boraxobius]|uniref:uncharacterized protein LOC143735798 n=1 Tax=Siphateles boraxobius TaxID=180520 RepID=UPI004064ACFE
MQPAQYPAYQPVPTQPGYGVQSMQTGPYHGQPYAPGPPPSYNMAEGSKDELQTGDEPTAAAVPGSDMETANPGYLSVQAPYDGSQATYPMMPPAQPGSANLPSAEPSSAYPPPAQPGSASLPAETFDQPSL